MGGESIQIRRADFLAAVTADIGVAKIVGEDEENVGAGIDGRSIGTDNPYED